MVKLKNDILVSLARAVYDSQNQPLPSWPFYKRQAMTQKERVLYYLQQGNTITPLEALRLFSSLRLSDIIFRLKKEGHNIETELVDVGDGKRVARYKLRPKGRLFV